MLDCIDEAPNLVPAVNPDGECTGLDASKHTANSMRIPYGIAGNDGHNEALPNIHGIQNENAKVAPAASRHRNKEDLEGLVNYRKWNTYTDASIFTPSNKDLIRVQGDTITLATFCGHLRELLSSLENMKDDIDARELDWNPEPRFREPAHGTLIKRICMMTPAGCKNDAENLWFVHALDQFDSKARRAQWVILAEIEQNQKSICSVSDRRQSAKRRCVS